MALQSFMEKPILCLQKDTKNHDNQIGIPSYINMMLHTLVENR